MKTSFKFKNLIYSIILVPFVFAVLPQQNSSLEKTTDGNSAFSTIDPAKSKNDSYIEQIAMGGGAQSKEEAHSAAVLVDQNGNESLYTWGSNDNGQLGLGYTGNPDDSKHDYYATPQKVTGLPEGDIEQISLGNNYSAAVVNDGNGDELYTWGLNDKGQLGTGEGADSTNNLKPTQVKLTGEIEQISTNTAHSAAIVNNGEGDQLYTWGTKDYGRLGREPDVINPNDRPGLVSFNKENDTKYETGEYQIKDVSVGNVSSAAIITDTTDGEKVDKLYTWGNNGQKQCGIEEIIGTNPDDDYKQNYYTPVNITSNFDKMGITSFEDIVVGATSAAVVAVNGNNNNSEQLYTWGSNEEYQLGIEPVDPLPPGVKLDEHWNPQEVNLLEEKADIKEISLYNQSMSIVINSGNGDELWTWGKDNHGQLGNGENNKNVWEPTKIEPFDTNITQVTSGYQSSMAITNNGTSLYVWGDNTYGQLGVEGSYTSPHEIDFYSMIPDIPFVQKWYFYFMLVILIFLIIGLIIGLVIYLKKRQLVR